MSNWMSNWISRVRLSIKLNLHACAGKNVESKTVVFINDAPNAEDNRLSIYGPIGSFQAILRHCTVCGHYGGQKYNTYGGYQLSSSEAEDIWLADNERALQGIGWRIKHVD